MPFVFHCPQCASTLKTGMPVSQGRTIQCPHCSEVFTASETTVYEEHAGAFQQLPVTLGEPHPLESAPIAKDDRQPPRRRTEGERDSRRYEDERRPRRRAANEDDRDRNRSRGRVRYEDEPPRRRRRYEEDYDRPRARSGGNRTLVIVLLVLAAGMAGLIALALHFGEDDEEVAHLPFAPGVDTEMLALAPRDSVILVGVDVTELRKNGRFARLVGNVLFQRRPDRQQLERHAQEAGLSENDVSGVLAAATAPDGSGNVLIIRFNKDIDRNRLVGSLDAVQHTDDFKKYYTWGGERGGFFFAGQRLMVIAENPDTLKYLLHHDRMEIQISQELHDLAAKASGPFWMAMEKEGGQEALKAIGIGFGPDVLFPRFAEQTESLIVSISAQNDQLDCELGLKLKGDKNARDVMRQMKTDIDAVRRVGLNNHPNVRNLPADEKALVTAIHQSATFRTDGSIAYLKYRANLGVVERLVQNARGNRIGVGP